MVPCPYAAINERTQYAREKIAGAVDAKVIEVFPTASAKILGFYSREYKNMASSIGIKAKNRHEVDAYIAALTGILHLEGKTEMAGEIVVPAKLFSRYSIAIRWKRRRYRLVVQ